MSEELRHRFSRLTFYTLLLAFLSVSMTFVIFSTVAQPTLTCIAGQFVSVIGTATDACSSGITPSFDTCGSQCPIMYWRSQVANYSNGVATGVLTGTVKVGANDTIFVATHGDAIGENVTSITDTIKTNYIMLARVGTITPGEGWEDLWYGHAGTFGMNILANDNITVNWGTGGGNLNNLFIASVYAGVDGIGAISTATNQLVPSVFLNTTLTVANQGGSWVLGVAGSDSVGAVNNCGLGGIYVGSHFLKTRAKVCGFGVQSNPMTLIMADNATRLYKNTIVNFSADAQDNVTTQSIDLIEVEVLQANPDFQYSYQPCAPNTTTPCCQNSGNTCHINAVEYNTRAAALNKALFAGTTYCTGITSFGLTTTSTSPLIGWGSYGGVDLNVTGATNPKLLVAFNIGITSPSTVFAAGSCGTGTIIGTASIYFAISGALSPATTFSVAVNGIQGTAQTGNTYFAWFDITPQNFAGHMNYDQVTTTPADAVATISLMQIK